MRLSRSLAIVLAVVLTPLAAAASEPVKVRWGTIANASQAFVPTIIKERGLDKKYGLDLTVVPLSNTDQQWLGLRSGDTDVSSGSMIDLLRQRQAGLKAKAFRGFMTFANPIVARTDKPYNTLADLKGARIGTARRTLAAWIIYRAAGLKAYGVDLEKNASEVVESPPTMLLQLMLRRELDASAQFSAAILEPMAQGKLKEITNLPKVLAAAGFDADSFYLLWMVNESWSDRNPGALARLVAAIDEANDILATDDAIWPALGERVGVKDPKLLPLFMKTTRFEFKTNFSRAKLEPTQALIDAMVKVVGPEIVGTTKVDPDAFYFDAVEKARELRKK